MSTLGLPAGAPIADNRGFLSSIWLRFVTDLWLRTGGASGQVYLDAAGTISVQYIGTQVVFLNSGGRVASLDMTTGNFVTKGTVTPSGAP